MPGSAFVRPLVLAVVVTWCLQVPMARSALIGLQPDPVFAGTGDSITLDLVVSGLGSYGPDSLGAFDLSVGFDPSALSFTSYTLGSLLGNVALFEAIDASAGNLGAAVNIAEVSLLSAPALDALQPGQFVLASLTFDVTGLAAGATTQLAILSGPVLGDGAGVPIAVSGLGSARITNVPVPGTALLLMAGCIGWLRLNRTQRTLQRAGQTETHP